METKRHLLLLDGLRGIAALAVVAYHFGDRMNLPFLAPRGDLAVDFFFVLSGFVLAHAYGDRLRRSMTTPQFVLLRLIRLLPMVVPGTVLAAVIELWRPDVGMSLHHLAQVGAATILGCLALPLPVSTTMEQTIFPINGPIWSLFFEILANFMFVLVVKTTIRRSVTLGLMFLGAGSLVLFAALAGTVNVGYLLTNWPGGLPRVTFSFFAGVWLNQHRERFVAVPSWAVAIVLLAVMFVPVPPHASSPVFDLIVVLFIFPLLVGCAARSEPPARLAGVCTWAGDTSYPIYALHYPIMRAICFVVNKHALSALARVSATACGIVVICIASRFVYRVYDRRVRKALTQRLVRTPHRLAEPAALG